MSTIDLGIPGVEDAVLVGRGGFATVYRAYQPTFRRTVAVKVLSVGHVDELVRERFRRECQAMGLLSEHPSITTVFDAGFLDDGRPYLIMAYMPQGTMADRLRNSGLLGWQEATAIGVKLAGALEVAHQAGILHRDVKPANVLISSYGEIMLSDFGIARVAGGPETSSRVITASLAYAAPEIIEGHRPTVAADVYSLAATVHSLMLGEPPFTAGESGAVGALLRQVLNDPPPDLRSRGVPEAICEVLENGMSKDPDARPASAAALGVQLREAQARLGLTPTPLVVFSPSGTPQPVTGEPEVDPTVDSASSPEVDPVAPTVSAPSVSEPNLVAATVAADTGGDLTATASEWRQGQETTPTRRRRWLWVGLGVLAAAAAATAAVIVFVRPWDGPPPLPAAVGTHLVNPRTTDYDDFSSSSGRWTAWVNDRELWDYDTDHLIVDTLGSGFASEPRTAVLLRVSYHGSNTSLHALFESGEWETTGYRRFGLRVFNDAVDTLVTEHWRGRIEISGFLPAEGNLAPEAATQYFVMLAIEDRRFRFDVWPVTGAGSGYDVLDVGDDWRERSDWSFFIGVDRGSLYVYEAWLVEFDALAESQAAATGTTSLAATSQDATTTVTSGASADVPIGIAGTWRGEIHGVEGVWTGELEVVLEESCALDGICGTFGLTDSTCRGDLQLLGVDGSAYTFLEVLREGGGDCLEGGRQILTSEGENTLAYRLEMQVGDPSTVGTLTLVTEPLVTEPTTASQAGSQHFLGTWSSIDPADGSAQWLFVEEAEGEPERLQIAYWDESAESCDGVPGVMEGPALVTNGNEFQLDSLTVYCVTPDGRSELAAGITAVWRFDSGGLLVDSLGGAEWQRVADVGRADVVEG